ncbi:MAG TPA: hypothetical protein VGJ79_01460, partial [Candidatus Dormibacteraeota bacterium]
MPIGLLQSNVGDTQLLKETCAIQAANHRAEELLNSIRLVSTESRREGAGHNYQSSRLPQTRKRKDQDRAGGAAQLDAVDCRPQLAKVGVELGDLIVVEGPRSDHDAIA